MLELVLVHGTEAQRALLGDRAPALDTLALLATVLIDGNLLLLLRSRTGYGEGDVICACMSTLQVALRFLF